MRALISFAGSLLLHFALFVLVTTACSLPASAADSEFAQAVGLYNGRQYAQAAQLFERCLKQAPANVAVIYYCALSHNGAGNRARARQLYQHIVATFPGTQYAGQARKALGQQPSAATNAPVASAGNPPGSSPAGQKRLSYLDSITPTADLDSLPNTARIPFSRRGGGIYVEAQINGRPMSMHFDTGAPYTCVGRNHLSQIGMNRGPKGKMMEGLSGVGDEKTVKLYDMTVDLKIGPIYRRDFPVTIQESLPGNPLLGQTFFKPFYVTIDAENSQLVLRKKTAATSISKSPAGKYAVPFAWHGGHMVVEASVNGKPYNMIFDTGADNIAFTMNDLKRLDIDLPASAELETHIGTGGATRGWGFYLESVKLGAIEKENVKASVVEQSNMTMPLLGQTFFGDYHYTIDNENKLIRFDPR